MIDHSKFDAVCHPCFRVSGGMGDTLICCGVISNLSCKKTVFVRPILIPLIKRMRWLDEVSPISTINNMNFKVLSSRYTSSHNFDGCFANMQYLVDRDYYAVAAERIGVEPKIGQFDFPCNRKTYDWAIHTGASNPNRQWLKQNWFDLAASIESSGQTVCFLGTKSEWGYSNDSGTIKKLSDITDDLVTQSEILSGCKNFIGNDSGFCHIAGIIGVNGHVLFFNTKPENVINRYPSLHAIHQFDSIGEPTRAINPQDGRSSEAINSMTVEYVCQKLQLEPKKSSAFTNLVEITIIGSTQKSILFRNSLTNIFSLVPNSVIKILPDYNLVEVNGKTLSFFGGPFDLQRFLRDLGVA